MTPKEQAKELFDKYCYAIKTEVTDSGYFTNIIYAKQCALIAVNYIIPANPHSNPFNTEVYSTLGYWLKVKEEIELL